MKKDMPFFWSLSQMDQMEEIIKVYKPDLNESEKFELSQKFLKNIFENLKQVPSTGDVNV